MITNEHTIGEVWDDQSTTFTVSAPG